MKVWLEVYLRWSISDGLSYLVFGAAGERSPRLVRGRGAALALVDDLHVEVGTGREDENEGPHAEGRGLASWFGYWWCLVVAGNRLL